MTLGRLVFRPGLWPTLITALLLPLLLGLGVWQLERAAEKRALIEARRAGDEGPVVDLNDTRPPPALALHRRARAKGRFDADHQFLMDNQVRDGRAGYRILTPLRIQGAEAGVLVERGWVAAPASREQLPAIPVDEGVRPVQGRLGTGPSVGLRMGPAYTDDAWPRRIQYLDLAALEQALPYPLTGYVLETGKRAQGQRPPGMAFGPQRHHGYAVQWFALAGALMLIYVGVNTRIRDTDDEH